MPPFTGHALKTYIAKRHTTISRGATVKVNLIIKFLLERLERCFGLKRLQNFYLSDEITELLTIYSKGSRKTRSETVEEALRTFFVSELKRIKILEGVQHEQ